MNAVSLSDCVVVITGEREEIEVNADRLVNRCLTVDVQVATPRTNAQESALSLATKYLDQIKTGLQNDITNAQKLIHSLLNACEADGTSGAVDIKFQSIVLGCTAEDQKKIRKQLTAWLNTLGKAQTNIS